MNPFDFVNDASYDKKNIMHDTADEKQYNPWIVNKAFSQHVDTVLFANEMNMAMLTIDHRLQYDFYLHGLRKKKRFGKWAKSEKNDDLELVKTYFGYRNDLAEQILPLLSKNDLKEMRESLYTGGKKK
jgi:hypothetical protein